MFWECGAFWENYKKELHDRSFFKQIFIKLQAEVNLGKRSNVLGREEIVIRIGKQKLYGGFSIICIYGCEPQKSKGLCGSELEHTRAP